MQELTGLAEKLQAAVIFAQDAIGVIAEDHPLSAGFISEVQRHPLCADVLKDADIVLCVGMRMGTAEMATLDMIAPNVRKIVVGFDDSTNSFYQGEDQRVADPKLFLSALLERSEIASGRETKRWSGGSPQAGRHPPQACGPERTPQERQADPRGLLMDAMNAVLGDSAVVASDVGGCQMLRAGTAASPGRNRSCSRAYGTP